MDLAAADFTAFFSAIHGDPPFPWQQRLVDQLAANDEWPDVLDLPTGSGKTAALDAAVFHLALQFECPARAALRIVLVVDRRLVVDDAYERARRIEKFLDDPTCVAEAERGVLVEVARRLRHLAGDGEHPSSETKVNPKRFQPPPLVASRLRGGAPLESDWARTPTQPMILCSTVDQVGSRLLFRGYGVSDRMKPVHAGLFGNHSLILLDEAHLSDPFRQTLHAVREIGGADVRTVLLSATPGAEPRHPFGLAQADYANDTLKARLETRKPATLSVVRHDPGGTFAKAARKILDQLQRQGVSTPAVGVIVNRVGLAREIFDKLKAREEETGSDTLLLIGRSRSVERDRIVKKLGPFRTGESREPSASASAGGGGEDRQPSLSLDSPGESHARPLFVVATQCLEVGVDLDLDGLVTQAASFDALRQRFGRLNRAGRSISAVGVILALAADIAKNADDAVYGDRIAKTWKILEQIAHDGQVDFGITALTRSLQEIEADVTALAAPRASVPTLMPAYFDLWSQTSPPPSADPDVGLFLHGVDRTSAGVSLIWRSDITEEDLRADDWNPAELLQLAPPRAAEMVEVPLWSARAWLSRSGNRERLTSISDVPERGGDEAADEMRGGERPAFRWAGADHPRTRRVSPGALRPGDLLVVPAEYGGCDEFGWAPTSGNQVAYPTSTNQVEPVTDVADRAARPFRSRRHAVRVARDVVARDTEWDRLHEILADHGLAGRELVERLLDALPADSSSDSDKGNDGVSRTRAVREPLEALRHAKGRGRSNITVHFPYRDDGYGGVVLVARHGAREPDASEAPTPLGRPATEDDGLSHTAWRPLTIEEHTDHVVGRVNDFVQRLGDAGRPVASDLKLAAFLHDAGKADPRFQNLLSGGDPWNRPDGSAMAKSGRPSPKGAWERAGLPKGWRHEALSVRMAQAHPRFAEAHDPALVLWLIGTHHGFGRPFFGFVDSHEGGSSHEGLFACLGVEHWRLASEPGPQSMAFDLDGADWPAMYEQLRQRYGTWGLAHLEAVLRLADHRASESEQRDD